MSRGGTHGARVLSMAGGTAASRLSGLLRVLVLAWVLGFTPLADAFNLANSYASETITRATGLSYQKPAAILAPRTARVGFRFIF